MCGCLRYSAVHFVPRFLLVTALVFSLRRSLSWVRSVYSLVCKEAVSTNERPGLVTTDQWEARTGDHWPMRGQEPDLIKSLRVIHWDHWPLARMAWEWEKINPNKCVKWENVQLWRLMSFDVIQKLNFYNFRKRQEAVLILTMGDTNLMV